MWVTLCLSSLPMQVVCSGSAWEPLEPPKCPQGILWLLIFTSTSAAFLVFAPVWSDLECADSPQRQYLRGIDWMAKDLTTIKISLPRINTLHQGPELFVPLPVSFWNSIDCSGRSLRSGRENCFMEWKPVVLVLFPGSTCRSRLKGTLVQKAPHLASV